VTPDEAKKQVSRSKLVSEDLAERSKVFAEIWSHDKKAFLFCYDYGNGGIEVAEEVNGQLIWKKETNKAKKIETD
jgi:hypothetical protein